MSVDTRMDDTAVEVPDEDPATVSSVISLFAGIFAMLLSAPFLGAAVPFGFGGVLFIGLGLFVKTDRSWVSFGVASIFLGILLVGAFGPAQPLTLVIATVALFVSWDVGMHAIVIGNQLGSTAPTLRGEVVHAAASVIVGSLASGVTYGLFVFGSGGQPVLAVFLLVIGVLGLLWSLRD